MDSVLYDPRGYPPVHYHIDSVAHSVQVSTGKALVVVRLNHNNDEREREAQLEENSGFYSSELGGQVEDMVQGAHFLWTADLALPETEPHRMFLVVTLGTRHPGFFGAIRYEHRGGRLQNSLVAHSWSGAIEQYADVA